MLCWIILCLLPNSIDNRRVEETSALLDDEMKDYSKEINSNGNDDESKEGNCQDGSKEDSTHGESCDNDQVVVAIEDENKK